MRESPHDTTGVERTVQVDLGERSYPIEIGVGAVLPMVGVAYTAAGLDIPQILRWQGDVLSVMMGYNADVVLHWGAAGGVAEDFVEATEGQLFMPTDPWRGVAFLVGYVLHSLGLAVWIFHRRDVTYGS